MLRTGLTTPQALCLYAALTLLSSVRYTVRGPARSHYLGPIGRPIFQTESRTLHCTRLRIDRVTRSSEASRSEQRTPVWVTGDNLTQVWMGSLRIRVPVLITLLIMYDPSNLSDY